MICFSLWWTARLKMFHIVRRREKSPWSLGSSCYFQRDPSFRCHYPSNVFLGWMEVAWLHDRVFLRWRESNWSMSKYAQLYKTFAKRIEHTCACTLAFDVICPNYILFQPAIQRYIHPAINSYFLHFPPRNRNASRLRTCHSYWPIGILAIFAQQRRHMISTHQLLLPMTFTSKLGPFGSKSNPFILPSQKFITVQPSYPNQISKHPVELLWWVRVPIPSSSDGSDEHCSGHGCCSGCCSKKNGPPWRPWSTQTIHDGSRLWSDKIYVHPRNIQKAKPPFCMSRIFVFVFSDMFVWEKPFHLMEKCSTIQAVTSLTRGCISPARKPQIHFWIVFPLAVSNTTLRFMEESSDVLGGKPASLHRSTSDVLQLMEVKDKSSLLWAMKITGSTTRKKSCCLLTLSNLEIVSLQAVVGKGAKSKSQSQKILIQNGIPNQCTLCDAAYQSRPHGTLLPFLPFKPLWAGRLQVAAWFFCEMVVVICVQVEISICTTSVYPLMWTHQ